ncbi:MAG: DNA mismatch endonuclease Vsr [Rubrivivax sp.]|nr:DNA mismatch endonuclease Vsr [Rubrivivax sp.]
MCDVLTPEQRRLNMSRVRRSDTKPEMLIRRGLHASGLRYRLHDRRLPGRPDLVFPKYRAVVFVHGCFWHAHGCALSKLPATRREFWQKKLTDNAARDRRAIAALHADGWRVLVVWECALRGPGRTIKDDALSAVASGIRSGTRSLLEFKGSGEKRTMTEEE